LGIREDRGYRSTILRILYFADIRFPLERANGIQTMETCWALAERGHIVHLLVRPDTQAPPRDPFEYYGLPPHAGLIVERAPVTGPAVPALARRIGYLAFAAGRAAGSGRADIVMTRDLTVASLLLHLPGRTPIVFESHGYAPDVASALPDMVSTARQPSRAKLARLAKREAQVWRRAGGYVTITAGLAEELVRRFGARPHVAVVPDGTRIADREDAHETRITADHGDVHETRITADHGHAHETRITADHGDVHATRITADHGHAHETRITADHGNTHNHVQSPTPSLRSALPGPELSASITVAYAGHLYAWKGVELLLEAVRKLPEVRALIVGGHERESDLARLRERAARLGIGDRVTFTGQVPPRDVPAFLARADVLVLPNPASAISTRSTSPLKLFEYMAARRAIVASDLPAIREVLTSEVHALLVVPGDPGALAEGIQRLAQDPHLRERLVGAAFGAVAEYSWSRRAERLEALFSDVLASSRQ
jgi:glycosyltransferase involved in cell wall biosynthesis